MEKEKTSSKENGESPNEPFLNEKFTSLLEDFSRQLTELNKFSTLGPFISLLNDPQININNMREYGNTLIKYQVFLNKYLTQMINSYFLALDKVSEALQGKDPDDMRKHIIDSFEEVFSSMFESSYFSVNYNNLVNILIDLNRIYQKFFDTSVPFMNRQSLSKEEKDLLFNHLYEIRKLSLEIRNKLNEKNEKS